MQYTKLIFGPQRQNKLLFLLLKEKFDLTMLWGIVGRKSISMVNCSKFLFIIWLLLRQHFWKLGSHDLELFALLFALFGTLPKSTISGPFYIRIIFGQILDNFYALASANECKGYATVMKISQIFHLWKTSKEQIFVTLGVLSQIHPTWRWLRSKNFMQNYSVIIVA